MKRLFVFALLLLGAADAFAGGNGDFRRNDRAIKDHYVVVLVEDTRNVRGWAERLGRENAIWPELIYEHAIKGFSAVMSEAQAMALSHHPQVEWVEEDGEVDAVATQSPATWGLDRIDQRNLPLSNSYTYNFDGSGVHAYIIDTGIRASHQQFAGRMSNGYTAINDGNGTNDCNGHGTHVAGTVGGSTHGVAKAVTLHAVRVLGCTGSGSNSGVIAGVDWVRANRVLPAVANMSLGGGASSALDTAVTNAVNSGVTFAVAAGNSNANACNYSPARAAAAITVGATTSSDARSSFSNYGSCLDVFAPGSSITSAWSTSDSATNTISGTSMASPHVAGVAALYLDENGHQAASTVAAAIVNNATTGKVTSPGTGSPNRLLYSLFGGAPPPPTATPTPAPNPTPTPTPGSGTERIVNGGFEGSSSPWVLSGNSVRSTGAYPHGGTGYLIVAYSNSGSGTTYQQVSIPAGTSPGLSFWLNVSSSETTTTVQYDRLYVEVRNTAGTLLSTLATYSNLNKAAVGAYTLRGTFSLAAWAGQTVRVQFRAVNDFSLPTSFRVDDVSLK